MTEYLRRVFDQTFKFLKAQPPIKLAAAGITAAGILVGLAAMFFWAGRTTFAPLMTNLNPEDSANIMRVLREKRIPFQVDPSGRNITVPPENVDILRLELATMGLPQSSVIGYEVFDKQSLGTTSFVQKVNQKRALEGELMRTINTIRGVRRSRVHLALPQKSAFVEDQKKATASVVLDLEPGTVLNEKQVYGVGNLVSRAVEGMELGDVVIVDSNGKTLSKNASDSLAAATTSQLDFQQKIESDFEKRIESILSKVVGDGHVAAKVTAELDFAQVNETQTTYDADGAAVLSVERRNDTMNHVRPGPVGAAGAASNLPGQQSGIPEVRSDTTKANEVVNNLVPQTVRRTTKPVGSVKRLSVAVLVDGKTVKTVGKDGKTEAKVEAWPADKLKEFEDLVASAVGVDRKRGDSLEIRNMEFTREDFDEAQKLLAEKEQKSYLQNMVIYAIIGLVIGCFFLFVVRPFIKWITENTVESVDTFLPQTIEELERMQKNSNLPGIEDVVPVLPEKMDPEKVEGEMIKEKIVTLVDANPHKAALILKDWLHADAKKKAEKEKEKNNEEGGGGGKGKSASA
ncbi:MAG: flagellar M-ring protein FliF [Oligoflexia bacterium]|nr:flagellar M-ring protein FliF [Oligoflexia bacterium]